MNNTDACSVDLTELKDFMAVRQQGGSLRVTIPQSVVDDIGIEDGDRLRVLAGDDVVAFKQD